MDPILTLLLERIEGYGLNDEDLTTAKLVLVAAWDEIEHPKDGNSVAKAAVSVFDSKMSVSEDSISAAEERLHANLSS